MSMSKGVPIGASSFFPPLSSLYLVTCHYSLINLLKVPRSWILDARYWIASALDVERWALGVCSNLEIW